MSSSREREDSSTFPTNPSSSSSPITVLDHLDSYLQDSTSYIGSAAGSYSNEGLLAAETASPSNSDVEFGFSRPDFRQQSPISGTVQFYERHVFLCYKSPSVWPPRIEAAEFDRLPRLLSAAVLARKTDMVKELSVETENARREVEEMKKEAEKLKLEAETSRIALEEAEKQLAVALEEAEAQKMLRLGRLIK
ncbi:hypothetical protein V6N13_117957 [Hibiscus sabdariffa]